MAFFPPPDDKGNKYKHQNLSRKNNETSFFPAFSNIPIYFIYLQEQNIKSKQCEKLLF